MNKMLESELKLDFIVDTKEASTSFNKIIHNKKSRRNKTKLSKDEYQKTIIKWSLSQYVHPVKYDPFNAEFFPFTSSKFLNNGLSADSILIYLNSNLVFDFYEPKQNDKLTIKMEYKHPQKHRKSRPYIDDFIILIFNKKWEINEGFNHIDNVYKQIAEGESIVS